MFTREAYQKDFGICDNDNKDPFDLVRMHPKENIIEGGPVRTWIRKYVKWRIIDVIGLNMTEFFDLPYSEAVFCAELAEAKMLQNNKIAKDIENLK